MITIDHVTRTYDQKLAVDDLSLDIPTGELFAFLGPNGAGKTTTIKMLVGLLRPSKGLVTLNGFDVTKQPLKTSAITGYVPDEPYVYEKLTGREFLAFLAEVYQLPRNEVDDRIEAEIKRFELTNFVDQYSGGYSHGMKQRLVFAAALLPQPQVLIVDEPMVGLDPRSIRQVKDLLRAQADAGVTVFMSTHTLAVAEEIADRIGIMGGGRLRFLGTLEELRHAMASAGVPLGEEGKPDVDGKGGMMAGATATGGAAMIGGSLEELFLRLTNPDEPT